MCNASMLYNNLGRPKALQTIFFAVGSFTAEPFLLDVQELARKGRPHTTGDDIVLFVR